MQQPPLDTPPLPQGNPGYLDSVVILSTIVVTVGLMVYPRRVHKVTAVVLTLVTGTLLWANLRTSNMWKEVGMGPPFEWLDPVAARMFSRGWPLAPFMISLVHGMRLHTSEAQVYGVLFLDGVVFMGVLFTSKFVCEFCLRKRAR